MPAARHLKTETTEYSIWTNMLTRCRNVNNEAYKDYGGRGIKVCESWENSFQTFLNDMGLRPSVKHTLDRIDNDGDYCKINCEWRTKKQQANNRRSNVIIEYKGRSQNLKQWTEELGLKYKHTHKRIFVFGWSVEKAFEMPLSPINRIIAYNGKSQNLTEWAKELGIPKGRLISRLNTLGLSVDEAFKKESRVGNNQYSNRNN